MPTIRETLKEKKQNFVNFLNDQNKKFKTDDRQKFQTYITRISNSGIEEFALYIETDLKTYENNLELVVDKISISLDINKNIFSSDQINTFKRYLKMFCEILN